MADAGTVQMNFFSKAKDRTRLMQEIDRINDGWGRGTLHSAAERCSGGVDDETRIEDTGLYDPLGSTYLSPVAGLCGCFALKVPPAEAITRFLLEDCADFDPLYNIPSGNHVRENVCCICCAGGWCRSVRKPRVSARNSITLGASPWLKNHRFAVPSSNAGV